MVSNMKKMLISNPFLFPPSGDNEEEKQLFRTRANIVKDYILYALKDFESVWESTTESSTQSDNLELFPERVTSSTISATSAEPASIDLEMEEDDLLLFDMKTFDLEDIRFSPIELDKQEYSPAQKDLIKTTEQAIAQVADSLELEATMFPSGLQNSYMGDSFLGVEKPERGMGEDVIVSNPEHLLNEDVNLELGFDPGMSNDFTPALPSVPEETIGVHPHQVYSNVKIEHSESTQNICEPPAIGTRTVRQRRKSNQVNRNVDCSQMTFEYEGEQSIDLQTLVNTEKQEIKYVALPSLNGSQTRSRNASASSVAVKTELPVKARVNKNGEGETRRKRKYEIDDPNDPSVKNAKAAKMNRDKKKQQMQQLQKQVEELNEKNRLLENQLDEGNRTAELKQQNMKQEIDRLTRLLHEESAKNSANSKQKVTMFDLIKSIVSVVNPTPSVICVSDRLAQTPMPDFTEMESIRTMQNVVPNPNGTDTYLTFKVGIGGIPSITFDCENRPQH